MRTGDGSMRTSSAWLSMLCGQSLSTRPTNTLHCHDTASSVILSKEYCAAFKYDTENL